MLQYTGHPLVDVGVATILAFVGKNDPATLTEADLDRVANYIADQYTRQPLKSFLTAAFTSNAWFNQDAYNPDKPGLSEEERQARRDKRDHWSARHLRQWRADASVEHVVTEIDPFSGEPAAGVELSGRLQPGRAARAQIPMTFGDEYINFFSYGDAGIPISGKSLLCLQAFPLGCAKSRGRLLAVHSDNPDLTLHFAKSFLEANRQAVQLAQQSDSAKMPEAHYAYRTLLIDTLLNANLEGYYARQDEQPSSLTVYHLSNSGQGPGLDIYELPLQLVTFLTEMDNATYRTTWNAIVHKAWEVPPPPKKGAKQTDQPFQPRRNWLYEDLFRLPADARSFVHTYFLRRAFRYARADQGDPRAGYSLKDDLALVSWPITARFLWRIMNMEPERIEQIRKLGDGIADYIAGQNDRRFFRTFVTERRYNYFRTALINANTAYVRAGHAPFLMLDPYIAVFEDGDDVRRADWQLARDLVLIRVVEQLHEKGWLARNTEAVTEVIAATEKELETETP